MRFFDKAKDDLKRLFSKENGRTFLRKAENTGRDVVGFASKNANLIGELAPVAMALGQPEIAMGLTAVSKYAPKVNDAIQKKKPQVIENKPVVNFA